MKRSILLLWAMLLLLSTLNAMPLLTSEASDTPVVLFDDTSSCPFGNDAFEFEGDDTYVPIENCPLSDIEDEEKYYTFSNHHHIDDHRDALNLTSRHLPAHRFVLIEPPTPFSAS